MFIRICLLAWFGINLSFLIALPAQGETPDAEARLLSAVSDGRPAPETPEKTLPQYDLHWSKVHFNLKQQQNTTHSESEEGGSQQ